MINKIQRTKHQFKIGTDQSFDYLKWIHINLLLTYFTYQLPNQRVLGLHSLPSLITYILCTTYNPICTFWHYVYVLSVANRSLVKIK